MARRELDIGEAELETLKVLWDHGPAPVRDVMNILHEQGRQVAYTTVLSTLSRLEQKGFVASNKSGMAYVYRAKLSRKKVVKNRLRSMIEQLFDGSPAPLVLELMQSERFTPEEIAEFQRLIGRLDETRGDRERE